MLRTKIVCTIGPAARSPEMLREMIVSGMNVARLNFSHGDCRTHAENATRIREASSQAGKPVAILMDLQGPKLRVGEIGGDGVLLQENEEIVLTTRPVLGHPGEVPVQFSGFKGFVSPGDRILIDDGLLEIVVVASSGMDIKCRVVTGGLLKSNKGMNLPRAHVGIPAITEKDRRDLECALENHADWVALSFVRDADEVLELKELIRERSSPGCRPLVVAKIEKPEAMENIDAIISAADGIMVARGDLGLEASPEEVPLMQKLIIRKCNQEGVPVITATQMLDSMKITSPRNQASSPAERRESTSPFSTTQFTKPCMPPEYCVSVITAPISALKRMTRVLSASPNTATRRSTVSAAPWSGFQPLMIVQPSQIPTISDM